MKNVLVAYLNGSSAIVKMADYIAEGIRLSSQQATVVKIEDIVGAGEIRDYAGYIFGSATYSPDIINPMNIFFIMADKAGLAGKVGTAFGPLTSDILYSNITQAPTLIFGHLQHVLRMKPFGQGPFNLKEGMVDSNEGIKTCRNYGRAFGLKLDLPIGRE